MRMPSFLASTIFAAATLMGTGAALAGPFGSGGVITTTETSYESLVLNTGDVLSGIAFVSSIQGGTGVTYTYNGPYLTSAFTGFTLAGTASIAGGTRLMFTGGSLGYYSFATDPFAGGALTNGTTAQQGAALTLIQSGTPEILLSPEIITGAACPIAGCTLYIDVFGGLNNFAAASTSTVYLDIIGGVSAGLFQKDTLLNTFTAQLADANYQGSANTQNCSAYPEWQVCGTNHATFAVIPEPLTLSLFGAGLAGVAAIRRRKAKKAA